MSASADSPHAAVEPVGPSIARQWLLLAGLTFGLCITNGFARFAYGLLLPAMKVEFGWTYAQAGWLNTANALGYVVGAIASFVLIRRFSPALLFNIGVVTTMITLMATGFGESLTGQTVWRFLTGAFGALSFSTGGALAAALFPGDVRRNALSIAIYFGVGGGLGILLAGVTLPWVLDHYGTAGWPYGWVAIGIMSILLTPLSLWAGTVLRPPANAQRPSAARLPARAMLGTICGYGGFGMGYIVYLTFIAAWMTERNAGAMEVSLAWVVMGTGIVVSPFVWRGILARSDSGLPLALVLVSLAAGTVMPILIPGMVGLFLSAGVVGLAVFMSPGAVTNFARKNLPQPVWGQAISLYTLVFAVTQTVGPIGAGIVGDLTHDIGNALLAAAGILMTGALCAILQRPLQPGAAGP
ncbi:YbfB/YjiJ family MFS transporter [Chachezhania sediminis]|uniref:YbfB/YjiJ family MFS transporter n=1 Tax=Chachezhania sediminis TaxID=2599291 RepID=UPI00131E618C|nr:YbfB/YjiJ family MFS transporter [Chachezhania sediminis]